MARPKKSDSADAGVLDGDLVVDGAVDETAAEPEPEKTATVSTTEDMVQILMRRTLPNLLIGPVNYGPLENRKMYKVPLHVADHLRSIDAA